jgi:hypothetical protein
MNVRHPRGVVREVLAMERGGNPMSPRRDDEMKHEMQGYLRCGRHTHAEEMFDAEPDAEDDIRVGTAGPVPPPGAARIEAEAREEADRMRLELARHLDRTSFPADRSGLMVSLTDRNAPDDLLAAVEQLPEGGKYHNAQEVVAALYHQPVPRTGGPVWAPTLPPAGGGLT